MTLDLLQRVIVDAEVMTGKPVIRGTRMTVEHILRELAGGMTADELLDAHPRLVLDDIRAAYAYAAARLAEEDIVLDIA